MQPINSCNILFSKAFLVFFIGFFFVFSGVAQAQEVTTDSLLQQINELLEVVESLQEQLNLLNIGEESSFSISRNLSVGDVGEDVRNLQQLFNKDPRTVIAKSGPGSIGNESTYFGNLTKDSVIKFQEIYRDTILVPNGLAFGTGFVGPSTLNKLKELYSKEESTQVTNEIEVIKQEDDNFVIIEESEQAEEDAQAIEEIEIISELETDTSFFADETTSDTQFYIMGLSNYYVRPGDEIQVSGSSFSDNNNSIIFGSVSIKNISTDSPSEFIFTVPDVAPGIYEIEILNGFNTSRQIDIVVTAENPEGVTIESVSPAVVSHGTTVLVSGTGFTKEGNMVVVDEFSVDNLYSKDGKTISFVFSRPGFDKTKVNQDALDSLSPSEISILESLDMSYSPNIERDMFLRVINTNGTSDVYTSRFK